MRRLMAAVAWPVVLLVYFLVMSAVVVIAKKDHKVKLKVDIRKETLVGAPSCQHTFTQIELLNLHPTAPIMIHSIQTTPEETILTKSESGASDGRKWEDHSIPQQIHVSKLPSGSVSLGPGQVAIVPVTFLPRFPNLEEDEQAEQRRKLRNNRDDDDDDDKNSNSCSNAPVGDNYTLEDDDGDDGQSPPPISITALYDLVDLVGDKRILHTIDNKRLLSHSLDPSYRRRNNLDPSSLPEICEFEVRTTVVVDTSRGVVKLPITASSLRDNLYQLPDTILFHHPSFESDTNNCGATGKMDTTRDTSTGPLNNFKPRRSSTSLYSMDRVVILDTLHANDHQVVKDGASSTAGSKLLMERECYDLYLSNPMPDRELQIVEALISKPDYLSIKFDPGRVTGVPDSNLLVRSNASQVIRQWSQEGPLYLPPDSDDNYILTICTAFPGEIERDQGSETYLDEMTKWIDNGNQDGNLGFLQIRTDGETLFIGLEHSSDIPYLSLRNSSVTVDLETNVSGGDTMNSLSASTSLSTTATTSSSSLLKPVPDHVDFGIISPSSQPRHVDISLQNKSPVPIRVMRISASLQSDDELLTANEMETLGLLVYVTVASDDGQYDGTRKLDSLVIGPATSLENALTLSCSVDSDRFLRGAKKDVYILNGTVIIRGTMDTELSYNEWLKATMLNPYRDDHLMIEFPFTVSILNGRIEAIIEGSSHPQPELFGFKTWDLSGQSVSHLYFPMNQHVALQDLDGGARSQVFLGSNQIRHDIRILSNNAIPLLLDQAVIDDHDEQSAGTKSLCQRFNVSTVKFVEETGLYPGFSELGLLELTYKFGKTRKSPMLFKGDSSGIIQCMLKISTRPVEAGSLNLPLWIFPGHLEVPSMFSPQQETLSSTSVVSNARSGFTSLLDWCRSSTMGMAFLELLRARSEDKKGSKSDSTLLSTYIKRITPQLLISAPKFLPIVLHAGAVDHGDVAKTSLYLTNRNPIPISVSIDVGELEGSEIMLSREGSLSGGDGNSLWDYLPDQGSGDIVEKGIFEGHPVDGIIEFFLSNRKAQDFLSGFSFRDSISPHNPSLEQSVHFRTLYEFHSRASFHRAPFEESPNADNTSESGATVRPSEYDFRGNKDVELSNPAEGALIMASDRKLVKTLNKVAGPISGASSIEILVPPGSEARFVVQVRAPRKEDLDSDISQLLGTGLVLSTSLGDVMPIFATFEALQGQLQATGNLQNPYADDAFEFGPPILRYSNISVISLPPQLDWNPEPNSHDIAWEDSDPINIPPREHLSKDTGNVASLVAMEGQLGQSGIPLYLKSTFTRNMRLIKLESCNPWFLVNPVTAQSEAEHEKYGNDGVLVGYLRAKVDCSDPDSSMLNVPSYYQCLYNWLMNRLTLQPEGCGLGLLSDAGIDLRRIENIKIALRHGLMAWPGVYNVNETWKGLAVDFRHDNIVRNLAHVKTGRSRNEGVVADKVFYITLLKAIEVSTKYGYNWLSTSLTATVEYNSSANSSEVGQNIEQKQNLTLPIRDLALKSTISPPRLFRPKSNAVASHQFPPTPVSDVSESYIPLYNPTNVPVTVRIRVPNVAALNSKPSDDERILLGNNRGTFIPAPYVQDGKYSSISNQTSHNFWWEGEGAFFLLDPSGDMIRSRHNITIRTGAGGTVHLVNPSLDAHVGVLARCGRRCGLRDDNEQAGDHSIAYSPIGASAAAGITLMGRLRNSSPHANIAAEPEPKLLAGGISVPGTSGPSAFAVPYSSLDDVVIPPFGHGHVGPIFFRPPGSFKGIGCSVARRSGAKLAGLENDLCKANTFESLIYLENSMTGLEYVVLQGRSLSERVIFVDSLSPGEKDVFATIENHHGKPTLSFASKSDLTTAPGQRTAIVKEVILHNDGDTVIEVAFVGIEGQVVGGSGSRSCSAGNFELRGCLCSSENEERAGYSLRPGQNESIFVEYRQDCSRRVEYANLVAVIRSEPLTQTSATGDLFQSRFKRQERAFSTKEVKLQLSFTMDNALFASCAQASSSATGGANGSLVFHMCLLLTSVILLCFALRARFYAMRGLVRKISTHLTYDQAKKAALRRNRSHWNAAFRCLARADPSSAELQGLGREQVRQVVSGLYKARRVTPPSSLNSISTVVQERRVLASSVARKRTEKNAVGGNERIRTLSDAIFQDTVTSDVMSIRRHLPTGIVWRTAFSRGILNETSTSAISFDLKTKALQKQRDFSDHNFIVSSNIDYQQSATQLEENESANGATKIEHEHTVCSKGKVRPAAKPVIEGQSIEPDTGESLSVVSTSESEGTIPVKVNKNTVFESNNLMVDEGGKDTGKESGSIVSPPTKTQKDSEGLLSKASLNFPGSRSPARIETVFDNEPETSNRQKKGDKSHKESKPIPEVSDTGDSVYAFTRIDPSINEPPKRTPSKISKSGNGKLKPRMQKSTEVRSTDEGVKIKSNGKRSPPASSSPNSIRPPPGLTPPPGFGGSPSNALLAKTTGRDITVDASIDNLASLESMLDAALSKQAEAELQAELAASPAVLPFSSTRSNIGSGDIFFPRNLDEELAQPSMLLGTENRFCLAPPAGSPLTTPDCEALPVATNPAKAFQSQDVSAPALLNEESQNGFDVMDFLDSILNEGGPLEDSEEPSVPNALLGSIGNSTPVLANPWASENRSRASAYGIAFNEDDDSISNDSTSSQKIEGISEEYDSAARLGSSIPLLTPAAILNATGDSKEDDNGTSVAISFFSDLVDE
ncbi:hypothetical protein IV203_035228 [Nitzschia inconspicua]|uniref:Uncharacterized protein n=1 Tax=Nitzschia inconspicua TaxID=303405 RepID=A0A9K3LEA8_9STRA|nr:hypothetical protein IV203_035228 [Nitzschia inconspicua]